MREQGLRQLSWLLGLNLILGVFAYRDLLRFRPRAFSEVSVSLTEHAERTLFIASETAPLLVVLLGFWLLYRRRVALFDLPARSGPL